MEEKRGIMPAQVDEGTVEKVIDLAQLDADKVLTSFGKYGKYQMMAYIITNLTWLIFAAEMMVMPFITAVPSYFCDLSSDYEMFNLVCSNTYFVPMGTSIFMIGSMLATPFLTQISDRFGRRWAFLAPLWLTVASNILCALSPSYTIFLALRFIAGVGTAGMSAIGWVLCCESVSLQFRSTIPLCGNITWVAGYLIVGVLAHFIPNWRWLYFVLSAPGIFTIIFYWVLPESLHWMITQKNTKGIKEYIDKASKFNNKKVVLEECMTLSKEGDSGQAVKRSIIDIFRSKALIFHLMLFSYIAIVNDLYYWALALFSVDLSEDRFTGYILSGLVEVPAGLIVIPLLQWFSRRSLSFASIFAQGVSMLLLVFVDKSPALALLLPLVGKAFNIMVWSSVVLILPEMIPTTIRNVFYGIVVFLSNIGSIAAPYIGHLKDIDARLPPLVLGVMSVIAAFCVLFFPETKGIPLPEDLEDLDAGPFLNLFARRKRLAAEKVKNRIAEKQNAADLDTEKNDIDA